MRIIERKDAKYLLFGILEISEKKRENHSNSEKKHFERKEASQMCLASFHIKRDTEKSISANLGIFLPRQCPCSRTTVLKNTRRLHCFLYANKKIYFFKINLLVFLDICYLMIYNVITIIMELYV